MIELSSLGTEVNIKYLKLNDNKIKLKIIDTPGRECLRTVNERSFERADAIILVYDITKRESFEACKYYYEKAIRDLCLKNTKILLLGNKKDLEKERQIPYEEAKEFADYNNYLFMEVSCREYENIYEAFTKIIESIFIRVKEEGSNDKPLNREYKKKNKKKDCIII